VTSSAGNGTRAPASAGASAPACARCGRSLAGRSSYLLGTEHRCLPCALRYRPMLRRSALTSLVVGTVLVLINQGGLLVSGPWPASLLWQIPLTYAVPFCVATWGALGNGRRSSI
jgi:hypothetical protein